EDGDDDNGGGGSCVQSESIFSIAIGTEIVMDGIKHVVKQATYSAARAMWIITACLLLQGDSSDYEKYCKGPRDACITNPWKDGVRLDCASCYQNCLHSKGVWKCPVYD